MNKQEYFIQIYNSLIHPKFKHYKELLFLDLEFNGLLSEFKEYVELIHQKHVQWKNTASLKDLLNISFALKKVSFNHLKQQKHD